ncbi:MAG: glycosyltransferase family 1 protein, partial [Cyanobacteria bacterium]|nr:glycosyltransferase family 1 protein [Cyanobacteriota bacterium]
MNNSAITNKSCPEPGYLDASVVDVLAPNLKWRLSGVTATVVRLVPIQAKEISIAAVGPNLPFTVPQIRIRDLLFMSKEGPLGARVWHARRNNEMIVGLFLKMFLGKNLRLLFTSASQRRHTWISRLLMGQMEAIVSTSKATAAYLKRDSLVVHHGIDLDGFAPLDDCTPLRTKLGLPKTSLLIGCYGRIRFQKGTDVFVDAMLELLPRYPEVTAVVMGRATAAHESFLQDLNNRVRAAGLKER